MSTWLRTLRALSLVLFLTTSSLGAQTPGLVVQPRLLDPQAWIAFSSVELYRTPGGPALLVRARATQAFEYFAFDPPDGKLWSARGRLPAGEVRFLLSVSGLPASAEGVTVFCRSTDHAEDTQTGFFLHRDTLAVPDLPAAPADLESSLTAQGTVPPPARPVFDFFVERQKALAPLKAQPGETPAAFVARHPWIRPDSVAVANPHYQPDDFFSARFVIRDKVDLPFRPDPRLTGTWKYLYAVEPHGVEDDRYVVHQPSGPVDLAWFQSLTVLPAQPVYPHKDVSWRGLRLGPKGGVEVDVGPVKGWRVIADFADRWTSGWLLSTSSAIASELFFSSEGHRDLLWLTIKSGDTFLGLPPSWVVFYRDRNR